MRILINIAIVGLFFSCSDSEELKRLEREVHQLKEDQTRITAVGDKNKTSARAFFKALESENLDILVNLFAENALHINPYHSDLFPKGAKGRQGIRAYWRPVFPNFAGMTFHIEEIYAMENPNFVFVKYKGDIKLKNDAGVYSNDYYSTFKFDQAGKIIEYVEIFNPIVAARGFGLLAEIK